jgi:hypothetical protein
VVICAYSLLDNPEADIVHGFILLFNSWRRMRRASEVQLGAKALLEYEDIQKDESVIFAYDMLARPENCKENILRSLQFSSTGTNAYPSMHH